LNDVALATAPSIRRSDSTYLLRVISGIAIVAGLYLGKDLLVPFALALLLSFLLSTPVTWLQRLGLKKVFAVSIVLTAAMGIALGFAWLGVQELTGIVSSLPQYRANMIRKLESVRNPAGLGLAKLFKSVDAMKSVTQSAPQPSQTPLPVRVVKDSDPIPFFGTFGTSVLSALVSGFAAVVLTLFLLLNREHLRNRMLRLTGQGRLLAMTTALDDATQRVSRYLLTQSLVNSAFGTLWGLSLYFIGVPYAAFWGVAGAMLRFIPYAGTFLAGACPVILASIALTGWRRPLIAFAVYVGLEGTISSVVEPWLYATRTGISSLAILLSAAFWTLLWGPIGLILSTPLTVCLAVIGRHIPALGFLYVLLGDEPVLSEDVRFYQRLLAQDEDEATQVLEQCLKQSSLTEVFDTVVIPALGFAERDRHAGRLEQSRAEYIFASTRELIDEVSDSAPYPGPEHPAGTVVCVPARDEADATVNLMLVNTLRAHGFDAFALDPLEDLGSRHVDTMVVSALPPLALMPARSLCRKFRKLYPEMKIVLAIWTADTPSEDIQKRVATGCIDSVAISLKEALERVQPVSEVAPLEAVHSEA
jgi:predicted PurR-regulated permease PerM